MPSITNFTNAMADINSGLRANRWGLRSALHQATPVSTAVTACGTLPEVVTSAAWLTDPATSDVQRDGIPYHVYEARREIVNAVTEQSYLDDQVMSGVYPGMLIQGSGLLNGDLAPIGPLPRPPGTLTVMTNFAEEQPASRNHEVLNPNRDSLDEARRLIMNNLRPQGSPGSLSTNFCSARSMRQASTVLGLHVKSPVFDLDADANTSEQYESTTTVAVVRQIFYSVHFSPSGPTASGFFNDDQDVGELSRYMGTGNPPLYVDTVYYGRLIVVTATAKSSSEEMKAAMRAQVHAKVFEANANLDLTTQERLAAVEAQIYTIGVQGRGGFERIDDPISDLNRVYTDGRQFAWPGNAGAPVAFTARHVVDQSMATTRLAAQYMHPIRVEAEDFNRNYPLWDGPGGGQVTTAARVAPGDRLIIDPEGQAWSGVLGTGTHGPAGWPGWDADAGAPMPHAPAHAVLARIGSGNWFKVGDYYESPAGGVTTGGRILLNINDNNPYNGNANDKFNVAVQIERRGAGAAGIYV